MFLSPQRALENFLKDSFGELIENFDSNQLNVGLMSGSVSLENLTFKRTCFNDFILPIELRSGYIDSISIKVQKFEFRKSIFCT